MRLTFIAEAETVFVWIFLTCLISMEIWLNVTLQILHVFVSVLCLRASCWYRLISTDVLKGH